MLFTAGENKDDQGQLRFIWQMWDAALKDVPSSLAATVSSEAESHTQIIFTAHANDVVCPNKFFLRFILIYTVFQ